MMRHILLLLTLLAVRTTYGQKLPSLTAVPVASKLSQPLFVTAPPADYNRLFIVLKIGRIDILDLRTNVVTTGFIDLSDAISTDGEQGFLGLAFDPDYATNGKFYLNYVVKGGTWNNGTTRISQFQVSATNPNVADKSSERILLTFDHPQTNHNGGWIGFSNRAGDDHNLYIATGDGGNGYDSGTGHTEPGGNAQNLTTLLGKMLRIHVDAATGTASIPANNPFAGAAVPTRREIFCYGLRNPFRNSFDRANQRLMIGDVGQDTREELDVQSPANPGGGENYGWRVREGLIQDPGYPNATPPAGAINPVLDYPHSGGSGIVGNCITGGYVYRGKQIPDLRGFYVFADYGTSRVFTCNIDGTSPATNFQDISSSISGSSGINGPASFGEDANGELYVCSLNNGTLLRLAPKVPNLTIDSTTRDASGMFLVQGTAVPFSTVAISSAATLTQPFAALTTVTAAADGTFRFSERPSGPTRFYRATYP